MPIERVLKDYRRGGTARLPDGSVADYRHRTDVVASFVVTPIGAPAWPADCVQWRSSAVAAEKRANASPSSASVPRKLIARKRNNELCLVASQNDL
jgi:hypothetical protein